MPKVVAFLAALAIGLAPAWPRCQGDCDRSAPASVACERTHRLAPACAQGAVPCDSRPGMTAATGDETRRSIEPQAPGAVLVATLAAPVSGGPAWRLAGPARVRPIPHRPLIALRI
jgi:hypothetical protein